jgi:hypothetical protein
MCSLLTMYVLARSASLIDVNSKTVDAVPGVNGSFIDNQFNP